MKIRRVAGANVNFSREKHRHSQLPFAKNDADQTKADSLLLISSKRKVSMSDDEEFGGCCEMKRGHPKRSHSSNDHQQFISTKENFNDAHINAKNNAAWNRYRSQPAILNYNKTGSFVNTGDIFVGPSSSQACNFPITKSTNEDRRAKYNNHRTTPSMPRIGDWKQTDLQVLKCHI